MRHCLTVMWYSSFLHYHGAGELLDQISIVKSSSWSEGVSRWISPHLLSCSQIIFREEIKRCQSKPVSFLPKLTEKSNKPLRWLNCCFKQTIFFLSDCPRQTSGRLVLMFTSRTRWRSLKRAILESRTAACVSAGKHTLIHNTLKLVQSFITCFNDRLFPAVLVLLFCLSYTVSGSHRLLIHAGKLVLWFCSS